MSTQRRESHSTPPTEDGWNGALENWRELSDIAGAKNCNSLDVAIFALEGNSPAMALERFRRIGNAQTAPQWDATNSLQPGGCTSQPAGHVARRIRRGSPPFWATDRSIFRTAYSCLLSLSLIPSPPVAQEFHPALPQFPAAKGNRTERYDGKRDLHFQHAA